jgi:hypothetical protein
MASEGGGGGPKKNSPQDYLFGRIIGEGERSLWNFIKETVSRNGSDYYVGLGLEKPKAFGSQLAGKITKYFRDIYFFRDFRRNFVPAVSKCCFT